PIDNVHDRQSRRPGNDPPPPRPAAYEWCAPSIPVALSTPMIFRRPRGWLTLPGNVRLFPDSNGQTAGDGAPGCPDLQPATSLQAAYRLPSSFPCPGD